jgi:hypothetical protein
MFRGLVSGTLGRRFKSISEAPTLNVSVCDVLFCECDVTGWIFMVNGRIILTY